MASRSTGEQVTGDTARTHLYCPFATSPYPDTTDMVGNHLKTRRLDLGLYQKDVARQLGAKTETVTNWEKNYTSQQLFLIQQVIAFLGYSRISGASIRRRHNASRGDLWPSSKAASKNATFSALSLIRLYLQFPGIHSLRLESRSTNQFRFVA
jgi:transcriptional regulator with XRE-family HTH domain